MPSPRHTAEGADATGDLLYPTPVPQYLHTTPDGQWTDTISELTVSQFGNYRRTYDTRSVLSRRQGTQSHRASHLGFPGGTQYTGYTGRTGTTGRILRQTELEKEVTVPKRIIMEEIREKVIVVPEKVRTEKIVEDRRIIREKIVEIEKPIIQERIVEVPEYEYVEKVVEVPETVVMEKIREVPEISVVENIIEVPRYIYQEKIVEIPQYEIVEVPVEIVVEVPEVVEEVRIKELPVPQYMEIPTPEYVEVEELLEVIRSIPVPVEHISEATFLLPRLRPTYCQVDVPVFVPRFIEVPVPADLMGDRALAQATACAEEVQQSLSGQSATLKEMDGLAARWSQYDWNRILTSDSSDALRRAWDQGNISVVNSKL
ncbi:MAG: hypothetical protein KVP17_001760 [Porospora cf. gigantea B]|uniref:uncharacterized protein n=1 Tax=Porospora cf. gigantea B TaxID=2853592 RepID=UPI003571BF5F|nr:MAG: hypothetical protein KVP17_001760 [Porospora cf. gigantea B]